MYPYINFFGLNIPSYGLCMTVAIILTCFLSVKKACKSDVILEDMLIISAVTVGAGLLGGSLFYIVVTYSFTEILNYIKTADLGFIANSGLVFYGGLIGGISGALISSYMLKIKTELLGICVVPYIPLGHAIGRIGCMLAGCCHGFEYNGIFAVKSSLFSPHCTYFPIQAVEALLNFIITLLLLLFTKKEYFKHSVLFLYLIMYSVTRFCLEFLRGDEIRGKFIGFSTSQWISIIIFFICLVRILLSFKKNKSTDLG